MPALWSCSFCYKSFTRKGDLVRHEKLHSGYKPYACEVCEKSFSQYSGLKTHRNTHTGEKPHRCGVGSCASAFGDPSSCTRHRKEAHSLGGTYVCPQPFCGSSIKRRAVFIEHLRKHGIDTDDCDINSMATKAIRRKGRASRRKAAENPVLTEEFKIPFSDYTGPAKIPYAPYLRFNAAESDSSTLVETFPQYTHTSVNSETCTVPFGSQTNQLGNSFDFSPLSQSFLSTIFLEHLSLGHGLDPIFGQPYPSCEPMPWFDSWQNKPMDFGF